MTSSRTLTVKGKTSHIHDLRTRLYADLPPGWSRVAAPARVRSQGSAAAREALDILQRARGEEPAQRFAVRWPRLDDRAPDSQEGAVVIRLDGAPTDQRDDRSGEPLVWVLWDELFRPHAAPLSLITHPARPEEPTEGGASPARLDPIASAPRNAPGHSTEDTPHDATPHMTLDPTPRPASPPSPASSSTSASPPVAHDPSSASPSASPEPDAPLNQRVERAGHNLQTSWKHALRGISRRATNALDRHQVETLGELIELHQRRAFGTIPGIGHKTQQELRDALERLPAVAPVPGAALLSARPTKRRPLSERLTEAGVDLSMAWELALPRLSVRARGAFQRLGLETLGEVVGALERGELFQTQNVGRTTINHVREQLGELLSHGVHLPDESTPDDLADLLEQFHEELPDRAQRIVRARFREGLTLKEIGAEHDITRERVRQILAKLGDQLDRVYGSAVRPLMDDLLGHLSARAHLLHVSQVTTRYPDVPLWRLEMVWELLGMPIMRWHDRFITSLDGEAQQALERRLRDELRASGASTLDEDTLAPLCAALAPALRREHLTDLADHLLGLERAERGGWDNPDFSAARLYVAILRETPHPMTLDALARETQRREGSDEPPSSLSVHAVLSRQDEIFRTGRGRYLHERWLPIPRAELEHAAARAASLLRLAGEVMLVEELRAALVEEGRLSEEVSTMLLRDALQRRADVTTFKNIKLCAPAELQSQPVSDRQHVRELLRKRARAMTREELIAEPTIASLHSDTLLATLLTTPDVLVLGDGRYMHREAVGVTTPYLDALLEIVVAQLPTDRPVSATWVFRQRAVQEHPAGAFLVRREDSASVLWGLLRAHPRTVVGAGGLIMLAELGDEPMSLALERYLTRNPVCFPREFRAYLRDTLGYQGGDSTINALMSRHAQSGKLRRRPAALYESASMEPERALRWAARQRHIVDALERASADELTTEERGWRRKVLTLARQLTERGAPGRARR